jgi:hypothetical protein
VNAAPFDTFLSVGGLTLRVVSDDRRLASPASGSLAPFFADHGRADVEIQAGWMDAPTAGDGRLLFDSGGAWQLLESDGAFLFTFRSSIGGPLPYKVARFNQPFSEGDVQLSRPHFEQQHPAAAIDPLQYPLDELVMIHLLSQGKGVEIHACGLLDRSGRAYLFVGQSGAGKSTIARLWAATAGISMLSDERVVLRTDRTPIVVYGTPWQGDAHLASPASGPLAAVFFLNRGAAPRIAPVRGSQAAARLFSCAFLPFHDAGAVGRTMTAVEQVIGGTPCYDLWFAPDRSVVDVVARRIG